MDTGTAIVGAVASAICILPFVYMGNLRKKAKKKLLATLNGFASKHNGTISEHEIFRDMIIGLDQHSGNVFFVKKTDAEEVAQHIPLSKIKACKVVNTGHAFNGRTVTEKLELVFVPLVEKEAAVALDLYDMHKSVQLNGELQFAERWAKRLDAQLGQRE